MDKSLQQAFKSIRREFSMIEAMFSYTLDQDNGKEGSIKGYSRLWGWSRGRVRRFLENMRTPSGHHADRKRTPSGHPIHFIDKVLWDKTDRERTGSGHPADTPVDPTDKPNKPKPNKEEKKKQKKISVIPTKTDLKELILENNFIETKDKISEFFEYRMNMPAKSRYKTILGLKMLFKDLAGCRDRGLIISECIDEAMGRGWQTPKPDYFKNNKQQSSCGVDTSGGDAWLRSKGIL